MLVSKIGLQYTNLQTKVANKAKASTNVNNITLNNQTNKVSFNGFREWWEETKAYWDASPVTGLDNPLEGGSLSFDHNEGPIKDLYDSWFKEYKELKAKSATSSLSGSAAKRLGALATKLAKKGYKL